MANYIYLRGLKQVDHTVFGVADGQKNYYSPLNGRRQPYSSGQQVKRSILDTMIESIDEEKRAPITFNYKLSGAKGKEKLEQKEPWNPCDPKYIDQLIGGWMRAQSGQGTIKRRSPLSISAMRPLHPSLANLEEDESGTFDRSDDPTNQIVKVRDAKDNEVSIQDVADFLRDSNRTLPLRNWLKLGPRANGLFVFDVAIDLDRMFRVSTNTFDPEITSETLESLREAGWKEEGEFIIAPQEQQQKTITALAHALVNWRITSNQSRTFSPQGVLAIALSKNANSIVNALRADLKDDQSNGRMEADAVIDTTISGVELFVSPVARGYIQDAPGSGDAMDRAEKAIITALEEAKA